MATQTQKLFAEFLGTFLLVFTVSCHLLNEAMDTTFVALSIAAVLTILIYALGPVSGANFNPAVTLAISIAQKKEWSECGTYVLAQFTGSLVAALMAWVLFANGPIKFGPSFEVLPMMAVFLVEMAFTFMLCFVVLSCACVQKTNQYFGLAIGFVIVAGGNAGGWISGGAFNPAVALSLNISSFLFDLHLGWFIFYWMAEACGAALAAVTFMYLRPGEVEGEDKGKEPDSVDMTRKLVAEGLGTFFLVVTVGLNVLQPATASNADAFFSIAATLLCFVYALGPVSGGHFNPAVTVAVAMRKGEEAFSAKLAAHYIAAQLIAALLAGGVYFTMTLFHSFPLGNPEGFDVVSWPLANSWVGVALAELIFTFLLCYVVLCVATTQGAPADMFGLAIGFSVVAGGYAIGPVSGSALNPAIAIGVDLTHLWAGAIEFGEFHARFWHCGVYAVFEVLGGVLAALAYSVSHGSDYVAVEDKKPAASKFV